MNTRLMELLEQAKSVAKEYRALTGRPLGITGEVGEFEAARLLGLQLTDVRHPGYDAIRRDGGREHRLQIKTRCLGEGARQSGRLGRIDQNKEWDAVLLVLLDANLEAIAIYEAPREKVVEQLQRPGSKSRNERGALAITAFKSISEKVWER